MKCVYCEFEFKVLAINANAIPDFAPIVCEQCGNVGLFEGGKIRKLTDEEMEAIKQSPAWRLVIGPAIEIIKAAKKARSARMN